MEEVLEGRRVGVALRDFSNVDLEGAADRLLALLDEPDLRSRCVAVAREQFSLEVGLNKYADVYRKICNNLA